MSSATQPSPEQAMARAGQRLAATDRILLVADRTVRGLGGPGFETQTVLWLAERLEVRNLQSAVDRLVARYPVVTARLVDTEDGLGAFWRFRPGVLAKISESTIESNDPDAILVRAGELLSSAGRIEDIDPLRFHLLHRPDGRDVLVVQYNHVLMDNNAAVPLLVLLDQFSQSEDVQGPPATGSGKVVRRHLRRFDRKHRRQTMREGSRLWARSLRGGVVQLGEHCKRDGQPLRLQVTTRSLDAQATQSLRKRIVRTCGFPNVSMSVLASAFRAIAKLAPPRPAASILMAGIGLDLGLRGNVGPLFGNPVSAVPIRARSEEIKDRDELARLLGRQVRECLQNGIDLGVSQLMPLMSRRPDDTRLALNLALREGFSLWYAYFGSLDGIGDRFCGASIEKAFFTGPTWPPMGLTLLVNQYRGRMHLQATYLPDSVPEPLAQRFLDELVTDLTWEAS